MKKLIILLIALMALFFLSGCSLGQKNAGTPENSADNVLENTAPQNNALEDNANEFPENSIEDSAGNSAENYPDESDNLIPDDSNELNEIQPENPLPSNQADSKSDEGYGGALPDLAIKTLILKSNSFAGDESAEFTLVVTNSSPVPISLNENSITVKLIDFDSNQEIAGLKDGPYIELARFLGNGRMAYPFSTIKNPEFLKTAGIKKILAIVDAENEVSEKSESNNEKIFEIEIKSR